MANNQLKCGILYKKKIVMQADDDERIIMNGLMRTSPPSNEWSLPQLAPRKT